jgi:hypothetical protein
MDEPYLALIDPCQSSSEALLVIRGYFTEYDFTNNLEKLWINRIRQAGWKGSIYYLWWESSSGSLVNRLRLHLRWEQVKGRAEKVGRDYLSNLVSTIPEKSISLISHSLGARVIYYGIESWSNSSKILKSAILLGGAVRRNKDWGIRASMLDGKLINVYNSDDAILNTLFKIGELYLKSPCGLKPIKDVHPKIINVDATFLIETSSHGEKHYLDVLKHIDLSEI